MTRYPRDFWRSLQTGIEVAVGSTHPEKLLGVRDGFREYFRSRLPEKIPIILVPQETTDPQTGLLLSDEETATAAQARADHLYRDLGRHYLFYVVAEGGLDHMEIGEDSLYFVRYWSAISGPVGATLGASSSLQLPPNLLEGLDSAEVPYAIPGSRRSGGMLGSLTGGHETLRGAVASATFNALATLFFGTLEGNAHPRRGSTSGSWER